VNIKALEVPKARRHHIRSSASHSLDIQDNLLWRPCTNQIQPSW